MFIISIVVTAFASFVHAASRCIRPYVRMLFIGRGGGGGGRFTVARERRSTAGYLLLGSSSSFFFCSSLTGSWSAFNIAPCECDGREGMKKSIVAAFAGCLGSRDGCSSSCMMWDRYINNGWRRRQTCFLNSEVGLKCSLHMAGNLVFVRLPLNVLPLTWLHTVLFQFKGLGRGNVDLFWSGLKHPTPCSSFLFSFSLDRWVHIQLCSSPSTL